MNKDKKLFKSKYQMIVYLTIFALLIWAFVYLGTQNYKIEEKSDHEKFNEDFSLVDDDNVFLYSNNSEIRAIINKGTGIIFFGTNTSEWVDYYAKLLNDTAKEVGINEIYYYDFLKDRLEKNGTYQSIVEKLSDFVKTDDQGIKNIYAPTLLVIKDDEVLYFDDETSFIVGNITAGNYWNENQISLKTETLKKVFNDYLGRDNNGK